MLAFTLKSDNFMHKYLLFPSYCSVVKGTWVYLILEIWMKAKNVLSVFMTT